MPNTTASAIGLRAGGAPVVLNNVTLDTPKKRDVTLTVGSELNLRMQVMLGTTTSVGGLRVVGAQRAPRKLQTQSLDTL